MKKIAFDPNNETHVNYFAWIAQHPNAWKSIGKNGTPLTVGTFTIDQRETLESIKETFGLENDAELDEYLAENSNWYNPEFIWMKYPEALIQNYELAKEGIEARIGE